MTTTITRCPAWCADLQHHDTEYPDLDEGYEQHESERLAWSDDGAMVWLSTTDDDPAELTLSRDDQIIDVVATPADLRRLADCLTTLAKRMEADQ
jgi:hypothetical protein